MNKSSRILFAVAVFCLLFSGTAGLVYEVVWARYLALFLGHTSLAVVAVLVAFMGGLALGNALLGGMADRTRRPLAFYAWLEIGIAAYALLFPWYYDGCHRAYIGLAKSLGPGSGALSYLRFAFSLLVILLPTVLMGGTLPVLTRLVTRSLGELRGRVAYLYATNSTGAVIGCILADFWWIPSFGLEMTAWAGAAMNLVAGLTALILSGLWNEEKAPLQPVSTTRPPEETETFTPGELRLAVISIGISGFTAMLYEVVWTRILALSLGSSTHSFSIMLITFITGIAAGAWIVGRWRNLPSTMTAFGWAELALAGTVTGSMFFYEYLPFWFCQLSEFIVRNDRTYALYELLQGVICFGVMFIPTLCLGMTLPLVSRIATAELAKTGRSVGKVFAVNTIGTVLGAAATGLWLMPRLGMACTFALGAGLNAAVGLAILYRNNQPVQRLLRPALPLGIVALVGIASIALDSQWRHIFTLGAWRHPNPPATMAEFRKKAHEGKLRFYADGSGTTVSLHEKMEGKATNLFLKVNGKTDAGTLGDMLTQLNLGHIPMLLHPNPKEALVIGFGSGTTCGAVARHSSLEHLDMVEISPDVIAAGQFYGPYNHQVLKNPKCRLVIEDAKTFLQMTGRQYDVIISEPSNPWMAGVSGIFSREYYETCRQRLRPDGIMAQWVQIYESNEAMLQMILGTFATAFADISIWQGSAGDIILLGSNRPLPVNLEQLEQRFNRPELAEDYKGVDLARFPVFLCQELISSVNGAFLADPGGMVHSDYFPTLEYVAQRAFFTRTGIEFARLFGENNWPRSTTLMQMYLSSHQLSEEDYQAFSLFQTAQKVPDSRLFRSLVNRWQADFPKSAWAIEISAKLSDPRPISELEATRMTGVKEVIYSQAAKHPLLLQYYASHLWQRYIAQRSVVYLPPAEEVCQALERLVKIDAANRRVYRLQLAEIAWDKGDDTACFRLSQEAFDPDVEKGGPLQFTQDPKAPSRILARLADTLWLSGKAADAWELLQDAVKKGHIGTKESLQDSKLIWTYRRIEAAMNSQQRKP